jgi:hypothetical protein
VITKRLNDIILYGSFFHTNYGLLITNTPLLMVRFSS